MNQHAEATCQRFIERRALGWTLERIAAELHVTKRTLSPWTSLPNKSRRRPPALPVPGSTEPTPA
jgi:hypothetical protein